MTDEYADDPRVLADLAAERSVLGACLLRAAAFEDIRDAVTAEDFYRMAHRQIFAAVAYLRAKAIAPDLVTLRDRLQQTGELDDCGGISYLAGLVDTVPRSTNVVHYAGIVRRQAILRTIVAHGQEAIAAAYEPDADPEALLNQVQADALAVASRTTADHRLLTTSELFDGFLERLANIESGDLRVGVATGLSELDLLLSGLPVGLTLLAARTSVGKTALALHFAKHAADHVGPVAFFSLEMDQSEICVRVIASTARINSKALQMARGLSPSDWRRVSAALATLEPSAMAWHLGPATLSTIRAKARRLKAERGLALIVVDYLQLVELPPRAKNDTRDQELGRLARALRALGKELGTAVVVLCQLNREPDNRTGGTPRLSDLRESGSLEQDADVVLLLHRPSLHDKQAPHDKLVVHVAKARQGPTGKVDVRYIDASLSFEDWDLGAHAGGDRSLFEEPTR